MPIPLLFFGLTLNLCHQELIKLRADAPPVLVQYQRIPEAEVGPQDMNYLPESIRKPTEEIGVDLHRLFPDADHLVIGIEAPHHWYLVAGNVRHDPRILKPAFTSQRAESLPVGRGAFWKISDPEGSRVRAVQERVLDASDSFSVACSFGVCWHLTSIGLKMGNRLPPSWLPSQNFARALREGFLDERGQPLQTELYFSMPGSLQEFYDAMVERDRVIERAVRRGLEGPERDLIEFRLMSEIGPFAPRLLHELRRQRPD